jgi:hypothetical protein
MESKNVLKIDVCRVDKDGNMLKGEDNKVIVFDTLSQQVETVKPLSNVAKLVDNVMKKHFIAPLQKDGQIVILPKAINDKSVVLVVSFNGVQLEVIKSDVFRAANNTIKNTDKLAFTAINFGVLVSNIASLIAISKGVNIELLNAIVAANTIHKDASKVAKLNEHTKIGLLSANRKKLSSVKSIIRKEVKEHSGLTEFRKELKEGSAKGVKFISDSAKF